MKTTTIRRHSRATPLRQRLVSCSFLATSVLAGWIDPDTPEDKRTLTPLRVVPAARPKKHRDDGDDDDDDGHRRRRRRHPEPTLSPTEWPTFSPTELPTPAPVSTKPLRVYDLVFSDEFDSPGRTFEDGADPRWTAMEKNDYTNDAQHYYSASNAYTDRKGHLVIKTEVADTAVVGFNDADYKKEQITKHFKSAMLQSWNKFCFTGGIVEAEIALPGRHDVGGLWPAFWLLGNLARHTYVGSSQHVWPWSSSVCTDKSRSAQLISACDRVEHYGLHRGVGRGAPEVDVFEVQAGSVGAGRGMFSEMPVGQPFMSSSFQVAPGKMPRPGNGWWPAPGQWYSNLTGGTNTSLNINFYGTYNYFRDDTDPERQDYFSDAISYNRQLDESHFGQFHRYRIEWELPDKRGKEENSHGESFGYLRWFLDDEFVFEIKGEGLNASGTGGMISSEPMYVILNTAVSSQWGFPAKCPADCPCDTYNCHGGYTEQCGFSSGFCAMMSEPPEFRINYLRVYQDKEDEKQKVGCSTAERPTKKFIEAHKQKYMQAGDFRPLKPIRKGGGRCSLTASTNKTNAQSCGGTSHGTCSSGSKLPICVCNSNWTGPHCMNPTGFDDIVYDRPEKLSDLGFRGPSFEGDGMELALIVGLLFAGILLMAPIVLKRKRTREGLSAKLQARYN